MYTSTLINAFKSMHFLGGRGGGSLLPIKIISLIFSKSVVRWGKKWEIPEKNHLTTRKLNLPCLT